MRPGRTSLPDTSTVSAALLGRIEGPIAAMRPLRTATSRIPSMPEAGHMTRPPRSSRSYPALSDIIGASLKGLSRGRVARFSLDGKRKLRRRFRAPSRHRNLRGRNGAGVAVAEMSAHVVDDVGDLLVA